MRLTSIDLFGFKSFAHKTHISFEPGVTAVVGPNGCGKSNLVDAVRWVLGEQRESSLRSERMENVIFGGTEKKRPLGMTEISLTLQDTDGILPLEYDEVTVTRRLYRSGKSEYLLNKSLCRLRDLNDLFMDTGIGPDSYSIMELKMIEGIISEDPDEMRKLFDEATGITRYKVRRKEALRRLLDARQDRERALDILGEVEKQANSLKRQVAKVRAYKRLQEKVKRIKASIVYNRVRQLEEQISPLAESLAKLHEKEQTASGQLNAAEAEAISVERNLLELENERRKSSAEYSAAQNDFQEVTQEKLQVDEKLRLNKWRRDKNEEEIGIIQTETGGVDKQISITEDEKQQSQSVLPELEEKLCERQSAFDAIDTKFKEARTESILSRQTLDELRTREADAIRHAEARKAALKSLRNRLGEVTQQKEEFIRNLEISRKDLNQSEQDLTIKSAELEEIRSKRTECDNNIEILREEIRSKEQELTRFQVDIDRTAMQIEHFNEMRRRSSPLYPAGGSLASIFPEMISATLSDELQAEEKYIKAVESALKSMAYSRVIEQRESFESVLRHLRANKFGQAALLVGLPPEIDLSNVNDFALKISGKALVDAVGGASRTSVWIRYFLRNTVLVDAVDDVYKYATEAAKTGISLVAISGEFTDGNGLWIAGESSAEPAKLIGVSEKLKELAQQLHDTQLSHNTCQQELKEMRKTLQELELDTTDAEKLQRDAEQAYDIQNIKKLKLDARITSAEMQLAQLDADIEALPQQIKKLLSDEKHQANSLGDAMSRIAELEKELHLNQEEESGLLEERETARQVLSEDQIEIERARSEADRLKDRLNELEERRQRLQTRKENLSSEILELDTASKDLAKELQSVNIKVSETGSRAQESRSKLEDIDSQRTELSETQHTCGQRVRELRGSLQQVSEEIHRIQIQKVETETTLKEEKPKLEGMDLESIGDEESDPAKLGELERKLFAMEPLNLAAENEHNEQKKRLDFLSEQLNDLDEAEKSLESTIQTLNEEAKQKFELGFGRIRENFQDIFKEIFDGGNADFRLIQEDTLESRVEILASPAGKRTGALSLLSGGEKALTAISLLFAIYIEKPSPFCILDEIDAPLDDGNTLRFNRLVAKFTPKTQFLIVTHNKRTMQVANNLLGVTMEEDGISKVVPVHID